MSICTQLTCPITAQYISNTAKQRKNLLRTAIPTLHLKGEEDGETDNGGNDTQEESDSDDDGDIAERPTIRVPVMKAKRGRKSAKAVQEDKVQQQVSSMIEEKDRAIKSLEGRVDELEIEIKLLQEKVNKCASIAMPFKKRFVVL